ncbi:MAG TPA: MGMT family protein [Candidatus Lokiarchaeia archaeon]|nr:MGMT family protein [Candidatus Lokiarchaeia archaeon]
MPDPFTTRVVTIIKRIPPGNVLTYGLIARFAGNPRGARQVSRILHSMSSTEGLPWHRVINVEGRIVLSSDVEKDEQATLLREEGIDVSSDYRVDLGRFLWKSVDIN